MMQRIAMKRLSLFGKSYVHVLPRRLSAPMVALDDLFAGKLSDACRHKLLLCSAFVGAGVVTASQFRSVGCQERHEPPSKTLFEPCVRELPSLIESSSQWKTELEKSSDGVTLSVRSAPSHSSNIKGNRYRTDVHVPPHLAQNISAEHALSVMKDMEKRVAWDPNIVHVEMLNKSGTYDADIVLYRTRPAAGGLISSREFIDARLQVSQQGKELLLATRWDENVNTTKKSGVQRAFNNLGVVACIYREDDGALRMMFWGHTEIGGWIPAKVLHATVADAHLKFTMSYLNALGIQVR
eukprot:TRINITY_DN17205_c1_g1_i1.p1 TRINITY_DN17205_c1_g1~~TRINITY_DN17205_c1_g1_i1.p1  ORF type:complete len:308 (+),score=37.91 TRINITY_DN17205_c1_g1_i1:38-925(+)